MQVTRLGILDCDDLAAELIDQFKSYQLMFEQLFERHGHRFEIEGYKVTAGNLPDALDSCSAYLVTGSKTGVYDDEPWLKPLREFIVSAYAGHKPLIGICFGHQLLADTLGGRAQKSEKGWGIGAYTVTPTEEAQLVLPAAPDLTLLYSHQDQVTHVPDDVHVLYGSAFCPNAVLHVPKRWLSFQGHPEFTLDYAQQLLSVRQQRYEPGHFDRAVSSLSQTVNDDIVTAWMASFIKGEM